MSSQPTNVVIAGLGGQGVIKASDILADVAFSAGLDVKKSELHGMSQRAPGPRMLLHTRHCRGSVVHDQHHVAALRRIVDHLDQAGDSAMHEGAVAQHAHHPPGLLGRQRVAQPQAHADGRAHADQRIHCFERRQHTQRIAADITRDDTVQIAQYRVDAAVWATGAQSRRLAGNGLGLWRTIADKNAAHAASAELAKAEDLRLALDSDSRGARGFHQIRVSFFDHDATFDACGECTHHLDRQRIGDAQLQDAGLWRGLAHMLERDPRSDDAELL